MRILLSNDDGIHAPGLRSFYAALVAAGHVVHAVAPATEQSGVSCGITAFRPLFANQVKEPGFEGVAVHGTPADSVMLGLRGLLAEHEQPDLVVSGINRGPNSGMSVMFSGTVGAAAQGALAGIPAMAVSNANFASDSREQAVMAVGLLERMDWPHLPAGLVYNLNFPDCPVQDIKGLKVCAQSTNWPNMVSFEERQAPYGRPYWWMHVEFFNFTAEDAGTDKVWLRDGYITLTPLRFDYTDRDVMETLRSLEE